MEYRKTDVGSDCMIWCWLYDLLPAREKTASGKIDMSGLLRDVSERGSESDETDDGDNNDLVWVARVTWKDILIKL